jgi:hypothetical protein
MRSVSYGKSFLSFMGQPHIEATNQIEQGDINASISISDAQVGGETETVNFLSSARLVPSNTEMLALLQSAHSQARELERLERELGRNKEFLAKVCICSNEHRSRAKSFVL